jgi:hypothetical protein
MKLVSVGIDPDHVGFFLFSADHVSIELSDLLWFWYCLIAYKCEMFSLKNIHLRLLIDWPQIFLVQHHLCFSLYTNFINQSFSVRSRLSNDRHAARLRGSLTISKCVLLLLFKMNAPRDWNRKGSSCGGVLGQLSHEMLVQYCFSSGLRLNDHTSNLFLTIVIT